MATIIQMHNAVRDLLPSVVPHFPGQAPAKIEGVENKPPWQVSGFAVQDYEVSEASLPSSFTDSITVTIAAFTEDQANQIFDMLCAALIGARVTVEGWQIGAIQPPDARGPYPAGLTATDTDLKYQVIRATFAFTASRR